MADLVLLSLLQKTPVRLKFRQGVSFTFEIAWLDENQDPDPDFADLTFLSQIRDQPSSAGALVLLQTVQVNLKNPIYVNPGEFVACVKKKVGTAPSAGVIAHMITYDYAWE